MKFVAVACCGDSFMQCIGVFDCAATAYGEAVMYLSENADKDCFISPLFELEGETGYGLELRKLGEAAIETVYVLFAEIDEPQGHAQSREVQHESPNV